MANTTKSGPQDGSDLLLIIGGKAFGHCTSHTVNFASETKDRAFKPVQSATSASGLWKNKGITGLSISISADGLTFYDEVENGYKVLMGMWKAGKSVEVQCLERGNDKEPYLKGKFVITSLDNTAPAGDDATYSISLENDGEPEELDESKLTSTPVE